MPSFHACVSERLLAMKRVPAGSDVVIYSSTGVSMGDSGGYSNACSGSGSGMHRSVDSTVGMCDSGGYSNAESRFTKTGPPWRVATSWGSGASRAAAALGRERSDGAARSRRSTGRASGERRMKRCSW